MNYYQLRRRRFSLGDLSMVVWIIAVSVLVSIIGFILFATGYADYVALNANNIFSGQYLWTIVTHMFAHAGLGHLFINMFVLFSLGGLCERIIGRKRFLWFYLLSGIFAGLLSVTLAYFFGTSPWGARIFGEPSIPMVGASGAIFAIAGLYVMLLPRLKFMILFLPFFSLPAYIMVPAVLFIMWILSVVFSWPVGNVAHFGGFLAGIIYGVYLRNKYKNKVLKLQRMFR